MFNFYKRFILALNKLFFYGFVFFHHRHLSTQFPKIYTKV